jgi:hypothetical protein
MNQPFMFGSGAVAPQAPQAQSGFVTNAEELLTPKLTTIGADEIFAPLPPANYICQELDICPGAPTLLAGYGYSGKTTAAMALVLEVALYDKSIRGAQARGGALGAVLSPPKVWGHAPILRGGRVLQLDFEMGNRPVREKYQRLLRGHPSGATVDDLRGLLEAVILPTVYLDQPETEAVLSKMCEGVTLCLIDSLRACAPSVEENSSDVRRVLDMLTRISEATGCVFVVIHHSRKANQANGSAAAAQSLRGSSAIYDACASVLVFTGEKNKPSRVQHEKARNRGICTDDFFIAIEDVQIGNDARAGLRVTVPRQQGIDAGVPEGWNDAESETHAKMIALLATKNIENKSSLVAQVPGNKQKKHDLASKLFEESVISHTKPIELADTAKSKIAETLDAVLERFAGSISLRQLQQIQGWEFLRTIRAVDGGASIADLRRWLAREGLDIYVRAAVDAGVKAGKLTVYNDHAKLVGWAELPDTKFGLGGVPGGSQQVPGSGTNQVPGSPPLRGGTGIGVVGETHQVPLPGNSAAHPPSSAFAQPPLDFSQLSLPGNGAIPYVQAPLDFSQMPPPSLPEEQAPAESRASARDPEHPPQQACRDDAAVKPLARPKGRSMGKKLPRGGAKKPPASVKTQTQKQRKPKKEKKEC